MLVVIVYCHVKADHVASFAEACRVNHEGSIREPGVLRFDVLRQHDDPTRFVLYEAYRGQADADFHKTTAHYAAWREATADWFEEPRRGVRYEGLAPAEPVG